MQDSYDKCQDLFDAKGVKYYLTPLYVTKDRDRLENPALLKGIICYVPIKCDPTTTSNFWLKRGTAIICHSN